MTDGAPVEVAGAPARRSNLRQAHWALLSQVLYSGANFALSFVVARQADSASFGAYTLVYAVSIITLVAGRSVVASPLMIRYANTPEHGLREPLRGALGAAAVLGGMVGAAALVVAAATGGALRSLLVVMAVALPAALVQDGLRSAAFTVATPVRAARLDAVWVVVQVAITAAVLRWWPTALWAYVGAWGAGAWVSMLFGLSFARLRPALGPARRWCAAQRDLATPLLGEGLLLTAALQVNLFLLGALGGMASVGLIRAGFLPFGVTDLLFTAAGLTVLPDAARLVGLAPLRRLAVRTSVVLAGCTLAWVAVVALLPDALGTFVLGELWRSTSSLRLLLGLSTVCIALEVGAYVGLKTLELARQALLVRLLAGPLLQAVLFVAAHHRYGVEGVAAAIVVSNGLNAALMWLFFWRARDGRPARLPDAGERAVLEATMSA